MRQVYLDAQAASRMLFGVPYIELNSQTYVALRGYENQKDKSKLSFLYLVAPGDETPPGSQLDLVLNSTITLNGGSIFALDTSLDVELESMPTGDQVGPYSPSLCAMTSLAHPNLCNLPSFRYPAAASRSTFDDFSLSLSSTALAAISLFNDNSPARLSASQDPLSTH